jgi:hypothetical protein
MHHWVFLFFVRFECIVRCFYSLFNLKPLLNAFVPCSISVFHLVFLFISLMLLHCCVYVCVFWLNLNELSNVFVLFSTSMHDYMFISHAWFECITKCLCSLFGMSASPYVFVPCLTLMHCFVFLFLVQTLKPSL